jgi:UDP-glucose 4-epimerase
MKNMHDFIKLNKPDCIINVAGPTNIQESFEQRDSYRSLQLRQVQEHMTILNTCATTPKYIYLSSGSVYGSTSKSGVSELDPVRPISPYAEGKLMAEDYLQAFNMNRNSSIPIYIFRGFSLFSTDRPHRLLSRIVDIFQGAATPTLFGDGEEIRDFISIQNFATVVRQLSSPRIEFVPGIYNLSSGKGLTVREICQLANSSAKYEFKTEVIFNGMVREGDPRNMVGINEKLKSAINLPLMDSESELIQLLSRCLN